MRCLGPVICLACASSSNAATTSSIPIPIAFPGPDRKAEVGVALVTRRDDPFGENTRVEAFVETPTVTDALTSGFTSVSGDLDIQVLDRSADANGGYSGAQAIGRSIVSIPDTTLPSDGGPVVSATPRVDASASASASWGGGRDRSANAQAQASLAYYFEILVKDPSPSRASCRIPASSRSSSVSARTFRRP